MLRRDGAAPLLREELLPFERAAIYALSRFMTLFLARALLPPALFRAASLLAADFIAIPRGYPDAASRVRMITANVPGLKLRQGMIHERGKPSLRIA